MKECRVVHGSSPYHGLQGLDYFEGVSRESCGSLGLCMNLLVLPPGARARAHYHESHETAIYVIEGRAEFLHGPQLENCDVSAAGDFVYIPAGVPHLPYNPTGERVVAVISRTDPMEQESVILCPDLDDLARERIDSRIKAGSSDPAAPR
jgi:uncharacterized RmlC-like cupin family protein